MAVIFRKNECRFACVHIYFMFVCYDGLGYHGSQIQGSQPTVQLALEQALATLLRMELSVSGASRTDSGVHALGNIFQVALPTALAPNAAYRLNALLPATMAVTAIKEPSKASANCRFDAISRLYRYRIYAKKDPFLCSRAYFFPFGLDEAILHSGAAIISETKSFETFCKRNSQTHTHKCTIMESRWERHGEELHYVVRANRFLRGMVRGLVGTQLALARGKFSLQEFRRRIAAADCSLADFSPPGHGLYLEEITFPEGYFLHQ